VFLVLGGGRRVAGTNGGAELALGLTGSRHGCAPTSRAAGVGNENRDPWLLVIGDGRNRREET